MKTLINIEEKYIFWDFDGVIKDSVKSKGQAFVAIFSSIDSRIKKKILNHHENHGGMSRFEKIPLYLEFASLPVNQKNIDIHLKRFSEFTKQLVIDSEWIPGVLEFIRENSRLKDFFLITATPTEEINEILKCLELDNHFKRVFGSPLNKTTVVSELLKNYKIPLNDALMLGDSCSDYKAAKENEVNFILRKTEFNKNLQNSLTCRKIKHFYNEQT